MHKLRLRECDKLLVVADVQDAPQLDMLAERAQQQGIVPYVQPKHLQSTSKVGMRAQMFNTKEGKLKNDFLIEQGDSSAHILNAISPAWTSAFPFARHVCVRYIL